METWTNSDTRPASRKATKGDVYFFLVLAGLAFFLFWVSLDRSSKANCYDLKSQMAENNRPVTQDQRDECRKLGVVLPR